MGIMQMVGHVHVRVHVREPLPSPPRGSRRARRIRPCRRLEPRPCRLRTSAGRRALEVPARGTEGHGEGGGGSCRDVFAVGTVTPMAWTPPLLDRSADRSEGRGRNNGPTFSSLRQCLSELLINGITGYPTDSPLSIYRR